jgi:hypothetical protein
VLGVEIAQIDDVDRHRGMLARVRVAGMGIGGVSNPATRLPRAKCIAPILQAGRVGA